jgi:hypothetical protein
MDFFNKNKTDINLSKDYTCYVISVFKSIITATNCFQIKLLYFKGLLYNICEVGT